jgi:hypothetical protein
MSANDRRVLAGQFLFLAVVTAVACSSNPTDPQKTTPTQPPITPTTTPTPCTAAQPMTSFTASPTTVTQGNSFTLSWSAPCGWVSLALAGQTPFATLQPSNGTYTLQQGQGGYPTNTGSTVYEAKNGDTATPRSATVTVTSANHDPAVTVAASAPGCHPRHATPQSCTVTCTASASDQDSDSLSYSWSGCATGSGTTATCTITQPGANACTVTVTDGKGGNGTGSATVTGTNDAPTEYDGCWSNGAGCTLPSLSRNWTFAGDAPSYRFFAGDDDPAPWSSTTCSAISVDDTICFVAYACTGMGGANRKILGVSTRNKVGDCKLDVTVTDDWSTSTTVRVTIPVN